MKRVKDYYKLISSRIRHAVDYSPYSWRDLYKKEIILPQTLSLAIKEPEKRTLETLREIVEALGMTLLGLLDPMRTENERDFISFGSTKSVHVRLPEQVAKDLRDRADRLGVSLSSFVRLILQDLVKQDRIMCPNCRKAFWVRRNLQFQFKCCPYCETQAKISKEVMIDDL